MPPHAILVEGDIMELDKLTQEAFAPGRHEILRLLMTQALRYTDIIRRTELSDGEVSRHIQRLVGAGLVEKQATGALVPTPLARLALRFGLGLGILAEHAEYFRTHDVHAMEERFLLRLGDLGFAEFLSDPVEVFEGLNRTWDSARTRFDGICLWADHIASGKTPPEGYFDPVRKRDPMSRLIVHDEDVRSAAIFHDGFLSRIEYRLVTVSRVDLMIGDDAAILAFAARDGRLDYNQAFFGTDPRFMAFCREYFESVWASARPTLTKNRAAFAPPEPKDLKRDSRRPDRVR